MENLLPLTDDDGEVRELTRKDFARMKPAHDILPAIFGDDIAAELCGGPSSGAKISTTLCLDPEVVTAFRAFGEGWQTRINDALRDWLKSHSPA